MADNQTILIADDDEKVRDSIRGVLEDEGYDVATARTGAEALRKVSATPPDLVLLDVWMPDVDGIEVLEAFSRTHPDLPVIIISGHGNVETAVRATKLGAVTFIEKPFSVDGLLATVAQALNPAGSPAAGEGGQGGEDRSKGGAIGTGFMVPQRTVAQSVVGGGLGLHSGVRTGLILSPLPPGSGIRFASVSGEGEVAALVENVDSTGYATTLYSGGTVARTVEHLMAALHAYGITNLLVKMEGEVPILDGSASEWCELLDNAGLEEQGEMPAVVIEEEIRIEPGPDQFLSITPHDGFRVTYELEYPEPVGKQTYVFDLDGPASFREQIAPARTFGFVDEIRALENAGLGMGGKLSNFILIGEQGIVNTELRFPEELARHKILDIMGDFYLLGAPIRGSIHARKTGHTQNTAMMRKLRGKM